MGKLHTLLTWLCSDAAEKVGTAQERVGAFGLVSTCSCFYFLLSILQPGFFFLVT